MKTTKAPYVLAHSKTGMFIACIGHELAQSANLADAPYFTASNERAPFHAAFKRAARARFGRNVVRRPVTVSCGFARF